MLEILAPHVGREEADEFHRVATQVAAALVGKARGLRWKEMVAAKRDKSLVVFAAKSARRDDAHTQTQGDVRLDHVRIERGEHDVGGEVARGKRAIDRGSARQRGIESP